MKVNPLIFTANSEAFNPRTEQPKSSSRMPRGIFSSSKRGCSGYAIHDAASKLESFLRSHARREKNRRGGPGLPRRHAAFDSCALGNQAALFRGRAARAFVAAGRGSIAIGAVRGSRVAAGT